MDAPEDVDPYAPYIDGWRRRFSERAARRRARAAEARTVADRCARLLAERHGARRVWLFGSTLTPERFDERSDIDIATDGVADWLRAALDCESVAPGFDVSIVPIEDATETMRRAILAEAVLLHDSVS